MIGLLRGRGLSCSRGDRALALEHNFGPAPRRLRVLADHLRQSPHPAFLVRCAVGIEVDDLAVGEAHAEAFLDEHVAFFLGGEGGAPAVAALARHLLLHERGLVVDQLAGFGEVDGRARLPSGFVVCRELGPLEAEEATPPILDLLVYDLA